MDAATLIVYLPFDSSPTEDLCGNSWTAYGNPTIADGALNLDGSSRLAMSDGVALGGQDFTIDCWIFYTGSGMFRRVFELSNAVGLVGVDISSATSIRVCWQGTENNFTAASLTNKLNHIALIYRHETGTVTLYVNGTAVGSRVKAMARMPVEKFYIGEHTGGSYRFAGSIDEFRVYDGVALHTDNFTPPTAEEYDELKADIAAHGVTRVLEIDVETKIANAAKTWRYENYGTADKLTIAGTTLTALPADKSRTGSAFYQTAREKCFGIPATPEIWIKFDAYFDGSNRWRAYNDSAGITAWNSSNPAANALAFFDSNANQLKYITNVCKTNRLQTVLLHMISGSSVGVIEAWVDGAKIYRYTGDVNHGEDFADIYLQSDGAGTFFSNVVVSNAEIGLGENAEEGTYQQTVLVDVEYRSQRNSGTYISLDSSTSVTLPDDILPNATEFTIELEISTTQTDWHMLDYMEPMVVGRDISGSNDDSWGLTLSGGYLCFWAEPRGSDEFKLESAAKVNDGQFHQIAAVSNADGSLDLYCDHRLVAHKDNANVQIADETIWLARNMRNGNCLEMDVREVRFWNTARSPENFFSNISGDEENLEAWYLPTEDGLTDHSSHVHTAATVTGTVTYMEIETVFVDVDYESTNDALAWRYEDCAVYIGTGHPIKFHVPKAYELWIRFDVYFDGVARWYAYDDGQFGMTGITALTNLALDYLSAGMSVKTLPDICKPKQTQTFLLHMISGATNGVIEVWAGLEQLESFFGNVNNGRPFVDFMLRSDDVGTSFTELIISNTKLNPDEKPSNIIRATKTSQLNVCNTKTGKIWLEKGGDYPFPYMTYAIREVIRQTIEETVDIGDVIVQPIISVWIKFEVLTSDRSRWFAYNDDENFGRSGICALTSGGVDFIANGAEVQHEDDAFAVNEWQTFLLHMESDATEGIIELWAGGKKISAYVGDVNGGAEFTDLYLVAEGDDVQFRNFVVSTASLDVDTEPKSIRATKNFGTLAFTVRHSDKNIVVPLKLSVVPIVPAFAVRYFGADWYCPLVLPNDQRASPILVRQGKNVYALAATIT